MLLSQHLTEIVIMVFRDFFHGEKRFLYCGIAFFFIEGGGLKIMGPHGDALCSHHFGKILQFQKDLVSPALSPEGGIHIEIIHKDPAGGVEPMENSSPHGSVFPVSYDNGILFRIVYALRGSGEGIVNKSGIIHIERIVDGAYILKGFPVDDLHKFSFFQVGYYSFFM